MHHLSRQSDDVVGVHEVGATFVAIVGVGQLDAIFLCPPLDRSRMDSDSTVTGGIGRRVPLEQ